MDFKDLFSNEYFHFDEFEHLSNQNFNEFKNARPFPYIYFDGLFNDELLDLCVNEFPDIDSELWQKYDDEEYQLKLRSNWFDESDMSLSAILITRILNSGRFLRSLSKLTGINGIIPDYYYTGGGLNQINTGGKLAIHVDGPQHKLMNVQRRINVILYLNRGWKEEWTGSLQLWDNKITHCVTEIKPDFNRLMIFITNDFTLHGHPEPLKCPKDQSRKSLIQYYYTSTRPESDLKSQRNHSAIFYKT